MNMKKISIALMLCLIGSSAHASIVKTVAPDGPYKIGVRIESIQMQDRVANALVWYPARPGTAAEPYIYNTRVKGHAVLDALPNADAAPYPLIVFSHGMGGCAPQHVFFNENLASYGYVVIAPDHDEASMCHIQGEPQISASRLTWSVLKNSFNLSKVVIDLFGPEMANREYDFSYRPAEIKAAIDTALEWNRDPGHFLNRMIEEERIGLAGHSLGGYTGLMVGGMPFLCEEQKPSGESCSLEGIGLDYFPDPCCFDYIFEADPYEMRDPRVKAIFIMSPAILYSRIPEAAAQLQIPVMLVNGDEFFEVPWEPVVAVYENAPAPKYLVRLKKVDHMTAAESTMAIDLARLVFPGFRSHFKDKAQAYKDLSAAFFNRYLKDDDSMNAALARPVNRFVELQAEP